MSTLSLNVALERPGFALRRRHDFALAGITALFGPSGSGKTTLLRVIAGLERDARGTVAFDGDAWQDAMARACRRIGARIGYVFQDGRLFPHLTVEQNLRFAPRRARQGGRRTMASTKPSSALDLRACSRGARLRCRAASSSASRSAARCSRARGSC